ncbi:MAG: DUF4843 domain-containing protein [Odoribacteraceae bacterium]|jgi:hypothetical protein|nr:DUF4843 domain-containing protein [Odoribacteraceae bacterium]
MNKIIFFITLPLAALVAACTGIEPPAYSGNDAIYFYRGTYQTIHVFQRDSLFYSFINSGNKERDTLYLDLRTMGIPATFDRSFGIEQANADSTDAARPGVHYIPFDDPAIAPAMNIPAGAVSYRMPLVLLRDTSLLHEAVTLVLRLVPNEHFRVGIERQATFQVKFSARFLPSTNWRPGSTVGWHHVFGEYGERKHWFIVTYVGFHFFEDDVSTYPLAVRKYYNQQAREKLAAYNAVNPVLVEGNGQPVIFPTI